MKKLLSLFICLAIFSLSGVGQLKSDDFLEVTIIDSIQVDAEAFTYMLFFYPVESEEKDDYKMKENPAIKFARDLVKEMKLDTIPNDVSFNNEERGHQQMTIKFKTLNDLKEFTKKIRHLNNIQGFVTNTSTSKLKEATSKLYEKLFEKGKEEAILIAAKSQRIPDKVIQIIVSNVEETEGASWTAYPPLSMLRNIGFSSADLKVIVARKITIRYSLK